MRDVQDKVVCARVKTHLDPVPSLRKHSFDLPLVPPSQVKLHITYGARKSGWQTAFDEMKTQTCHICALQRLHVYVFC